MTAAESFHYRSVPVNFTLRDIYLWINVQLLEIYCADFSLVWAWIQQGRPVRESQEVYDNYQKERELIATNIAIINQAEKPLLLFERESDRILFQKAFTKQYPDEQNDYTYSEAADQKKNGDIVGEGANALAGFLYSHIPKIGDAINGKKIIAIFDNDKDYEKTYERIKIENVEVLKHKKYSVYVTKLIPPDFRERWVNSKAKYCYLSVELLLHDADIPEVNRDYIPDTNPTKYTFKAGSKINFANNISNDTDFSGFQKTIDLIRINIY